MDEPCSALDPTSTRRIEETIAELAREVTIVIVTHNMQQAARVSAAVRVLPGRAGHARRHRRARPDRADLRAARATRAPPTTSTAGSADATHRATRRSARAPPTSPRRLDSAAVARRPRLPRRRPRDRRARARDHRLDRPVPRRSRPIPTLRHYGLQLLHREPVAPGRRTSSASPRVLVGTVEVALIALVVAFPLALGDRAVHQRVRAAAAQGRRWSRWST